MLSKLSLIFSASLLSTLSIYGQMINKPIEDKASINALLKAQEIKKNHEFNFVETLYQDEQQVKCKGNGFDNLDIFKKYLLDFKELIQTNQKEKVASLFCYPLYKYEVADKPVFNTYPNKSKAKMMIENKDEFLKKYDLIITNKVQNAFKNLDLNDIFINYQGAMIDNGTVWFAQNPRDPTQFWPKAINPK